MKSAAFFVASLLALCAGQTSEKDCGVGRDLGSAGCDAPQPGRHFYFDEAHGVCQPFMYRGCAGNGNRFASAAACKAFCVEGEGGQRLRAAHPPSPLVAACAAAYSVEHLEARRCSAAADCGRGFDCTRGFCCATPEHVCNLDYDAGKFAVSGPGKSDRYFYSTQFKVCMRFSFYGSLGNENNFPDYNSCQKMCAHRA